MDHIEQRLAKQPFLAGLPANLIQSLASAAKQIQVEAGQFACHEGDPADSFFLIEEGRVALQISSPGRGTATFQTIGAGEVFGAAWLCAPYRWTYDARALQNTTAIAIDAVKMREKILNDHDLGYELAKRFLPVLIDRLHGARLQLLDIYGRHAR